MLGHLVSSRYHGLFKWSTKSGSTERTTCAVLELWGGSRVAQLRPFKTPERLALEGALLMIHPSFSMMLRIISHWNLLLKDDFPSGNS